MGTGVHLARRRNRGRVGRWVLEPASNGALCRCLAAGARQETRATPEGVDRWENKAVATVADRGRHTVPRSPVLDSYRSRARLTLRQWRGGAGFAEAVGLFRRGRRAPVWCHQHGRRTVGRGDATQRAHSEAVVASVTSDRRGHRTRLFAPHRASWVRIGRARTGTTLAWVRSARLMASCTHFDRCPRARGSKHR